LSYEALTSWARAQMATGPYYDSNGDTANWLWSDKIAARWAAESALLNIFGSWKVLGFCTRLARSAPTNESPAPVTFTTLSIWSAGKCCNTRSSPEFPRAMTHRCDGSLRLCAQGDVSASRSGMRMATRPPCAPHFTTRCWKKGRSFTIICAIP